MRWRFTDTSIFWRGHLDLLARAVAVPVVLMPPDACAEIDDATR